MIFLRIENITICVERLVSIGKQGRVLVVHMEGQRDPIHVTYPDTQTADDAYDAIVKILINLRS